MDGARVVLVDSRGVSCNAARGRLSATQALLQWSAMWQPWPQTWLARRTSGVQNAQWQCRCRCTPGGGTASDEWVLKAAESRERVWERRRQQLQRRQRELSLRRGLSHLPSETRHGCSTQLHSSSTESPRRPERRMAWAGVVTKPAWSTEQNVECREGGVGRDFGGRVGRWSVAVAVGAPPLVVVDRCAVLVTRASNPSAEASNGHRRIVLTISTSIAL